MAKRYGLVIDLERCVGCQACDIACRVENGMETISGMRVETIGGDYPDTPEGAFPDLSMYFLPVPCMHCDESVCMEACPTGAIFKRADGIVILGEGKCDGCQMCLSVCPYDALSYEPQRNVVRKCNLCYERLDDGFEPFCATCCGVSAIYYGDLEDPASMVSQLISHRSAYQINPEKGTGPAVYYLPQNEKHHQ